MKKITLFFLLLFICTQSFAAFDDWFENKTLRIDYYHSGNENSESYAFGALKCEPFWGGSHTFLIDNTNYGNYYFKVFDVATNTLIYSRGYSTLFLEWQFTEEAKNTRRTMEESIVMPFPKKEVKVIWYSRDKKGEFVPQFEYVVKPSDIFIHKEKPTVFPVYDAFISGDAAKKIDIVILPEGYTASEMEKFKDDCKKFAANMFEFEPYKSNKDKFNIRGVLAPSKESGTDIPGENIWKNTLLNTSFYTFNSERYLMTTNYFAVRDVAANAPYDQIFILINTQKYGGGAIYNFYNTAINGNLSAAKVLIHEFGHGFAALADEYDDGSTSYNDLYPKGVEPWEPNITSLADFKSKWENMLPKGTPIPTPVDASKPLKLGVYEGAGYVTKGLYRPTPDCLMRTLKGNAFCPVCTRAIQQMIDLYTK